MTTIIVILKFFIKIIISFNFKIIIEIYNIS